MSIGLQAKLLRVLQEREIEPLGAERTEQVDVRVIAATNRDLRQLVDEGRFQDDLFYRLHVIPIVVPPLRERVDDIPMLVEHFTDKHATRSGKSIDAVEEGVVSSLQAYHWPGNVRELENTIERAVVLTTGSTHHSRRRHRRGDDERADGGRTVVEAACRTSNGSSAKRFAGRSNCRRPSDKPPGSWASAPARSRTIWPSIPASIRTEPRCDTCQDRLHRRRRVGHRHPGAAVLSRRRDRTSLHAADDVSAVLAPGHAGPFTRCLAVWSDRGSRPNYKRARLWRSPPTTCATSSASPQGPHRRTSPDASA